MIQTLESARKTARRLQRALRDLGYRTQLSACQAAVARGLGWQDWHHLTKTIGTDNAPKADRQDTLCDEIRKLAPQAVQPEAIADTILRIGRDQLGDEDMGSLVRTWAKTAVVGECGAIPDHDPWNAVKTVPLDADRILADDGGAASIRLWTWQETLDAPMTISEVEATLTVDDDVIASVIGTLYYSARRQGVSPQRAAMIADYISSVDFWTVSNIARTDSTAFQNGVFRLLAWSVQPQYRGQGIGQRLLEEALRALKRHYKRLTTLVYDPNTEGMPRYEGEHRSKGEKIRQAKIARLLTNASITSAMGPRGRTLSFANNRQGDEAQTLSAVGAMDLAGSSWDFSDPLENADRALAALFMANAAATRPPAKPLTSEDFPEGRNPLAMAAGAPLSLYPKLHHYMPAELSTIEIIFGPCDLSLRIPALLNRPLLFTYSFKNGETMKIRSEHFPSHDIDPAVIADLDKKAPASPYAPSYGHGTLTAILLSNTRLLFGGPDTPDEAHKVPMLAVVHLAGQPRTEVSATDWPDNSAPLDAVTRAILDALEGLSPGIDDTLNDLHRSMSELGWMDREMYPDTYMGRDVFRQRFNQTPWSDADAEKTIKELSSRIAPIEPHADCPAYGHWIEIIHFEVADLMLAAAGAALDQAPDLFPEGIRRGTTRENRLADLGYYGDFWAWWLKTHQALCNRLLSRRLGAVPA